MQFEKGATQTVEIDVYTRHGNTTLLLPPTFSGALEIRSRRGKIDLLPGLSRYARVLDSSPRELRLVIDRPGSGPSMSSGHGMADLARLTSRTGNFRVGLSVEDAGVQPEPGFWTKVNERIKSFSSSGRAGPSSAVRGGEESSDSDSDSDSSDSIHRQKK